MITMLTAPLSVAQAEALAENDWVALTDGRTFCVREILEDGSYGGDIHCSYSPTDPDDIPVSWAWYTVAQLTDASGSTRRATGSISLSTKLILGRLRGWTESMQNRIGLPISISLETIDWAFGLGAEAMPRLDDRLDRIAAEVEQIGAEARGASRVLVDIGADGQSILPCASVEVR